METIVNNSSLKLTLSLNLDCTCILKALLHKRFWSRELDAILVVTK